MLSGFDDAAFPFVASKIVEHWAARDDMGCCAN
jgi:hypothetical protein